MHMQEGLKKIVFLLMALPDLILTTPTPLRTILILGVFFQRDLMLSNTIFVFFREILAPILYAVIVLSPTFLALIYELKLKILCEHDK
jgi:hypothetical protein